MSIKDKPYKKIIIDFGGPQSLLEVKPYLRKLFSDPEILPIKSKILRDGVASLISTLRSNKSKKLYKEIGGSSPLNSYVKSIADKSSAEFAFKYYEPFFENTVQSFKGCDVILLPLFPFYSFATTKGVVEYFKSVEKSFNSLKVIESFYKHSDFVSLSANRIRSLLNDDSSALLLSYHSVPKSHIENGDPYYKQTMEFTSILKDEFGEENVFAGYQSKVGPAEWVEPSVSAVLKEIKEKEFKRVVVFQAGFICDNLESLYDIDIKLKNEALQLGFESFLRVPSLNDDNDFVGFVKKLFEGKEVK